MALRSERSPLLADNFLLRPSPCASPATSGASADPATPTVPVGLLPTRGGGRQKRSIDELHEALETLSELSNLASGLGQGMHTPAAPAPKRPVTFVFIPAKARSGGRRRSCNRCSAKKERCDGQEPCQRCSRAGLDCHYASCRTLGRPRSTTDPPKSGTNPAPAAGAAGPAVAAGAAATCSSGGAGSTAAGVVGAAPPLKAKAKKPKPKPRLKAAGPAASVLPLKRPRLSPSPATGLTGLVQNKYLTCFVDNFANFFQVLDETTIRLGLINLMSGEVDPGQLVEVSALASAQPKKSRSIKVPSSSSPRQGRGKQLQQPTTAAVGAAQAAKSRQREVNAINSSIFAAMSLGAMLLGQQPSHVHLYVAVAEASLRLCGITDRVEVVPSEHFAEAALLLAFATKVSGKEGYGYHIQLARQCYDVRVRHGLPTPPPVRDSLDYRAIIDAMGKPADNRDARIPPSSSREATITGLDPVRASSDSGDNSVSGGSGAGKGGGGSSLAGPGEGGGLEVQLPSRAAGGGRQKGIPPGGGGGESSASPPASQRPERTDKWGGDPPTRPGLEAARERRRLRKADPMSMVCDIMTMLSRAAHVEAAGSKADRERELRELRSVIVAEKALLEQQRFGGILYRHRSDRIGTYVLSSASIGLHCALGEFSELLQEGREVASCISSCPGLTRYQPHAYHLTLVILAAFGKREEFESLVEAAPRELRFSETQRPLTYDSHADSCSNPYCRNHAKMITEMRKDAAAAAAVAVAVDMKYVEEDGKGGQRESCSLSRKVVIRGATASGEGNPVIQQTQGGKNASLAVRAPSPPDSPARLLQDAGRPHPGPSLAPSAVPVLKRELVDRPHEAVLAGNAAAELREAENTAVERGQEYSSWPTPRPVSGGLSPSTCSGVSPLYGGRAASLGRAGVDEHPPSPAQAPSFSRLHGNGIRLGMLSAAATAMTATPTRSAVRGLTLTRSGGDGSGGDHRSSPSRPPGDHPPDQARFVSTPTYPLTAAGEGGAGLVTRRGAVFQGAPGNSSVTMEIPSFGTPHGPQRQTSNNVMPSSASPPFRHYASTMAMQKKQQEHEQQRQEQQRQEQQRQRRQPQSAALVSNAGGGFRAMQAAAPAGGTITSRLWGAQSQLSAAQGNGHSFPSNVQSPSPRSSILGFPQPCSSLGVSPPCQWQAPSVNESPPTALYSGAGSLHLPGNGMLDDTFILPPTFAYQGSTWTAAGAALGMGVGMMRGEERSAASSSYTLEGRLAAQIEHPREMTAGGASAAAFALATLSGTPTNRLSGASATGGGAGAEGVSQGESASARERETRERGAHEDEMMDLWEIIGTGDSE